MILELLQVETEPDATSADRLRAVYAKVRETVPAVAWHGAKLVPGVGDTLHAVESWLESATPEQADELLVTIRDAIEQMRDEHRTTIECVECGGACVLDPCDEHVTHEHRVTCSCGWVHTNNGWIVCDIKASRHRAARGVGGPISDDDRRQLTPPERPGGSTPRDEHEARR